MFRLILFLPTETITFTFELKWLQVLNDNGFKLRNDIPLIDSDNSFKLRTDMPLVDSDNSFKLRADMPLVDNETLD